MDHTELALPAGWDGLTELPDEDRLRELRFTDHNPKEWRFSRFLAYEIYFTVTIAKAGFDAGNRQLYSYKELIVDEAFGQPAPLGAMNSEFRQKLLFRLVEALRELRSVGISVAVNPGQYYWDDWAGGFLEGHSDEESILTEMAAENEVEIPAEPGPLQLSPAEAQIPLGIDGKQLKQLADLIDSEIENLSWDSIAHSMTAGQYVAPTVIRAYLKLLGEQK